MYDKMFSQYGHKVGQLLITKEDVDDPKRRENLIAAFGKLFSFGAIPIINENDAVAVDEIVYGDNDSLSAVVAMTELESGFMEFLEQQKQNENLPY